MGLSSKVLLLAVSLAAVMSSDAHGFPIPPVPLWSLVEQSETIVLAKVVEVREPRWGAKKDRPALFVVTLRVLETWKGPAMGEIEVKYPSLLEREVRGVRADMPD